MRVCVCVLAPVSPLLLFSIFISFVAVWKWILPCAAQTHQQHQHQQQRRLELALALVSPWGSSDSHDSSQSRLRGSHNHIFYSRKWNKKTFHSQVCIMLCHWATLRSPARLVPHPRHPQKTPQSVRRVKLIPVKAKSASREARPVIPSDWHNYFSSKPKGQAGNGKDKTQHGSDWRN